MQRIIRGCAWFFYGLGWSLFVALAGLLVGSIICEAFVTHTWDLDDGLWFLLPVEAAAGLYLTFRLRSSLWPHIVCFLTGGIGAVAFFHSAYAHFTTPAAMRPGWDGLPDRLSGLFSIYCGITVMSLAIGGLAGLVVRSRFGRNRSPST